MTPQSGWAGERSRDPNARAMGVVYLLYFLTSLLAGALTKGIVVSGQAATTASHILAHEPLYRSGIALDLIANAFYITLTAFFYTLFEPVNRRLALLAAFFSLVGCAIQMLGNLLRLAPLVVLKDAPFVTLFTPEQAQATALLLLTMYSQVFNISFVCFGLFMLLIGWIMLRSAFLPRIFRVFWLMSGVGSLFFLWPPLAKPLFGYILLFVAPAEGGLMLWLLVKGVNVSKWREQAGAKELAQA